MNVALVPDVNGQFKQFFKEIFFEDIQEKLPPLPEPQFELLADMQYRAKLEGYSSDWPDAKTFLIKVDDTEAGKVILHEQEDVVRIVDLMICRALRGKGLGAAVLHSVCRDAFGAGKELRLSVARGNPAIHLYLRTGFKIDTENESQIEMYKVS